MDVLVLLNYFLSFILFLYAEPSVTRKLVDIVVNEIENFVVKVYLPSIEHDVIGILQAANVDKKTVGDVQASFQRHKSIFDYINTEAKRFTLLKKKGFIDFQEFLIGSRFEQKIVGNNPKMVPTNMYGVHIPLKHSLKLFLQIPGVFKQILRYTRSLLKETYLMTNIIQGELWLKKYAAKFANELVLPLFVFYDDIEVGNALGSHAGKNKFGAVYTTIGTLPPHISSRLDSIIFTALFHTADKKDSSNEKVFQKLIEELNFLNTEGIEINVDGVSYKVKFQLVLLVGDNAGLNSVMGFPEGFGAEFFCRICTLSKTEASITTTEQYDKLRDLQNYQNDVRENDHGVKEECTFHKVEGYHLTENVSIDLMHDYLEGVLKYAINSLIETFIFDKKYFTLQQLNSKIENFHYGPLEQSNKPLSITESRASEGKELKLSAMETLCLVRYFALMIGHFIPRGDEHWRLYLCLRNITDILLSPRLIRYDAKLLAKYITEFHTLYLKLYGHLKPKFHILIHYPRILLMNGPSVFYWGMRFESFHRTVKLPAVSTSSRKNLLKTIATKQALRICQMMHSLEFESSVKLGAENTKIVERRKYFNTIEEQTSCKYYRQIHIHGTYYSIGTYIVIDMQDSEINFGKILDIVVLNNEIYFDVKIVEEITFDDHYHAYIARTTKTCKLVKHADLPVISPVFSHYHDKEKTLYISPRYKL